MKKYFLTSNYRLFISFIDFTIETLYNKKKSIFLLFLLFSIVLCIIDEIMTSYNNSMNISYSGLS